MKRVISLLMCFLMLSVFPVNSFAAVNITEPSQDVTIEYFEDGSYIETVLTTETNISTFATKSKSGTKTITYNNADGEALWKATLHAIFSYTGTTAACTESRISCSTYDTDWKVKSATASKSGNTATGNITVKYYVLGIPVSTYERTITMTCSASGTIS